MSLDLFSFTVLDLDIALDQELLFENKSKLESKSDLDQ